MARSVLATFKVAKQSAKGSAASSGYHCGIMKVSGGTPEFELADSGVEHGCAVGTNMFRDKTKRARTYYTIPVDAEATLYPNVIGPLLLGLGMSDSVSGTTIKTHVITPVTAASSDPYLSVLTDIGADSGSTLERLIKDVRVTQLKIDADKNGVAYSAKMSGLSEAASAGTETKTDEPAYKLTRNSGTFALTYDPAGTPVVISSHTSAPPRGLSMTIDNPVTTDDYALWTTALNDNPRGDGIRVEGEFSGLPITWSVYKQLLWGGASGTAPSATWVECSLDFKFNSVEFVSASTPYSLQVTIPRAEVWLDPAGFRARNGDDIRWTAKWRLYAGTGSPFTATLVNAVASY